MNTVYDNLKLMATEIKSKIEILILKYSGIKPINKPGDTYIFMSPLGNNAWSQLNAEGIRLQSELLEEYQRFSAIVKALLTKQSDKTLKVFGTYENMINSIIEQNEVTWYKNAEEAFGTALHALDTQIGFIDRLASMITETTIIPDTNALLFNPELESWKFNDTPKFTIILVPMVLSELDHIKEDYKNDKLRHKAEKLIRKFKEYRRRGPLTKGVTVVKELITIQAIALEPDFNNSLPWLDAQRNDDQIIASVIEVMRLRPRSPVFLVTRDINLQNKAELASIPFVEPPSIDSTSLS